MTTNVNFTCGQCGTVTRHHCPTNWPTPPAARQTKPTAAYTDGKGRTYCLRCARTVEAANLPLTVDDVDHWELCANCERHVVDIAHQTTPADPCGCGAPTTPDVVHRQPKPCRSTQHCAAHGFCHRCTPSLDDAVRHLVKAISAAGITTGSGDVYARLAATIRDAARQTTGQDDTEPCVCDTEPEACTAVGEVDPTIAADPVPLRWGLGNVLHGDDDSVIVCLSGPDREPYWLELDPERAAAFRQDLTPPDDCPQCGDTGACNGGPCAHPAVGQPAEAHDTDRAAAKTLETLAADLSAARKLLLPADVRAAIAAHRAEVLMEALDALEGLFIEDENPAERSLGFNAGLVEAITELRRMAGLPVEETVEGER